MKIKYLPLQPNCFAFGGFEIQILNNLKANLKQGLEVSTLDIWDRSADFDVLHCWGLGLPNYDSLMWGHRARKKLVISVLLYDYGTNFSKIKFKLSSYTGIQKYLLQMLSVVDAVSVVNELQAETCNSLYKVPIGKIHIIPNVVDSIYFESEPPARSVNADFRDYLLIVGNVCKRKNQLMLAEACIKTGIKLLIIGKVMDGEEEYGRKLQELVDHSDNLKWIPGLKENSDELINYYHESIGVVLPSSGEQQPLSTLEGAILRKPILLGNGTYSKQEIFKNACIVDPFSPTSIENGLRQFVEHPQQFMPDYEKLSACHERQTGAAYKRLYDNLYNK